MGRVWRVAAALAALAAIPACLEDIDNVAAGPPLDAPTGLVATAASGSIDLTWIDNSTGETGFRIELAPVPIVTDADITEFATVPSNSTAYSYPAGPNVTRYFRVAAFTSNSQSPWSNVDDATTANVPLPPSDFTAHVGPTSDRFVLLGWTDLSNETGYEIQRATGSGAYGPLVNLGAGSVSYSDNSTAYNQEYRYRIRGTNASGSGAWSESPFVQTRTTTWSTWSVADAFGDVSWHTSIGVFSAGEAWVSHYDATWGDVWLSHLTGGTLTGAWLNPGFPESLGYTGTSVAIDDFGVPHLVANDVWDMSLTLYYLTPNGMFWTAEAIAGTSTTDRAKIVCTNVGVPHVVYQQGTQLWHAVRTAPDTWVSDLVASDVPDHFGLAIDTSNRLHVAYRRPAGMGHELVHVVQQGGGWSATVVPTNGEPEYVSIACDGSDNAHIAYNELATYGLSYATNAGGSWSTETVHQTPGGSWGRYNGIAVDPATGRVHISYSDMLYDNLRYAFKDPAGAWQYRLLDGVGVVGRWTSIDLDGAGGVYISYQDLTNTALKVVRSP